MMSIVLLVISFVSVNSASLSCTTQHGSKLAYTAIKPPKDITTQIKTYLLYDSDSPTFEYFQNEIDEVGGPLEQTIQQLNQAGVQLLIWNDQPPNTTYFNPDGAHSKGIIGYSPDSDTAIYLQHSCPRYPNYNDDGSLNATIHYSQTYLGQLFHCQIMNGSSIDKILSGLQITNVTVIQNSLKPSNLFYINEFSKGNYYLKNDENFKIVNLTHGTAPVIGIFKRDSYVVRPYEDLVVPILQDSIYTETWGKPYLDSNCSATSNQLFVKNIGEIIFNITSVKKSFLGKNIFSESQNQWSCYNDHSKWAITANKKIVCISDMNHMETQNVRGGTFMCIESAAHYQCFNDITDWYYDCDGSQVSFHGSLKQINQ